MSAFRAGFRMRASRAAFGVALLAAAVGLFVARSPAAEATGCPNEAIREAQTSAALLYGSTYLPDCMALELVSPPTKLLQPAFSPAFSADGQRVLFRSQAALAQTPGLQNAAGDSYVASRTGGGWTVAPTSPPAAADIVNGMAEQGGPYAFDANFGHWLLLGSTQEQSSVGLGQIFSGGLDGGFSALSPELVPLDDSNGWLLQDTREAESTGSAAQLDATVFYPALESTRYFPDDPSEPGPDRDDYLARLTGAGVPSLELLARDKNGVVYGGRCGVHLGGGVSGRINQGAISPDGSRIFFSTRPAQPWDQATHEGPQCSTSYPLRIMERLQTAEGPVISELAGGEPEAPGDDLFQGASADGSMVYFTTTRQLVSGDHDAGARCSDVLGASQGCDLYLYDANRPEGQRLIDVSGGGAGAATPGEGADVLSSITAISGDGSHAYFVAQGVLTSDPNPEGVTAQAGRPNLYVYDASDGSTSFIGTLSSEDARELWGVEQSFVGGGYAVPLIGATAEAGGDGHILVFDTHASLTGEDRDGGYSDVYRYDADLKTLELISKAAPGGGDTPAADVSVNPNDTAPNADYAEQGRWVSEDGETIAFATAEPLAPGDEDGLANPYIWKEHQVYRLPSAGLPEGLEIPVVSPEGSEVAFTTADALLPQDGDTAMDIYVARVDGGFPNQVAPSVCDPLTEGSCRPVGTTLITAPPGSETFTGPGNGKPLPVCGTGLVRRRDRCVRSRQRRKKCRERLVRERKLCVHRRRRHPGSLRTRHRKKRGSK